MKDETDGQMDNTADKKTVNGKVVGHSTPSTLNQPSCQGAKAISKHEAEGKTHPKDAVDKARCQKVVNEYVAFQTTQKAETVKRNRSQDESDKPTKKQKVSVHTASIPKPAKRTFNKVARDHLQIALVDEITNRGKPASEKWSEIVVDHVMANPEGQVPGFDSMEVVRGYRVIKCDDQFFLNFLQTVVAAALVSPSYAQSPQVQQLQQLLGIGLDNLVLNTLYNDVCTTAPRPNATYDFIIVGAGPAGCVLANRLSENPNWTVYLIEAGGVEGIFHQIPVLAAFLQGTQSNWGYKSTPQKRACYGMYNNECFLPRGKILGGTSSINYMIYNRGNRRDFDRWAAAGNKGWSYEDVLPYFLKSENAYLTGLEYSPYHNHSGPLSVEDVQFRTPAVHAFVKGAQQAGHPNTDYNGQSQIGVSYVQANTRRGRRHSAYRAYIEPIRYQRRNLHIVTMARVTRVLINPITKRATGVELLYRNKYYKVRARKEVILSAGAFNSPQLLMLSGIGPADNLKAIDVPVVKELPVGKLLYDHMCHFGPTFTVNTSRELLNIAHLTPSLVKSFVLGNPGTMLSSIGGVEALAFLKVPSSKEPADMPDIEIITVAGSLAADQGSALKQGANFKDELYNKVYRPLERRDHFSFLIMQFHPKSVGRLWLHNRDPFEWPRINPKYFYNEDDVQFMLEGIKEAIRITQTPAMQSLGTRIHDIPVPGCEHHTFGTDAYWRCSIRTLSYTLHHQVATCRMGPESDPTTVVNAELKVHGIQSLRVVDTSIIPFPPTAHTNAASFMIGEKAADMIRDDWQ
ncbi:glucose dehydrogenase [FAD, quinone]-like [Anastrepha ludens]|uniref:glucose dehydrogenase [FAD, quinone]-like n=1 Tax=Anastrepha ludens TaxID=28586 RepID=UPI0023B048D0|nr:glucose dehydrogenase [FAD, quinone]-like [Anastrepha ludens]